MTHWPRLENLPKVKEPRESKQNCTFRLCATFSRLLLYFGEERLRQQRRKKVEFQGGFKTKDNFVSSEKQSEDTDAAGLKLPDGLPAEIAS